VSGRSTVEILRAARERISDPERWCTEFFAKTASGESANPSEPSARQWCVRGACQAGGRGGAQLRAVELLYEAAAGESVTNINDLQGHAAALNLLDRAISLAEEASC
jgi:hypothetical protein